MKAVIRHALPPVAVVSLFIGVWYLVAVVFIPDRVSYLLPTLHEVISEGLLDWELLQPTIEGLWETTKVVLTGFFLAILIGVSLAILMSQARWMERTLFPYAVTLQAVPIVAIVPLIGIWAGYEFMSKVIVTVIIAIFPIITNTLFGLRSVSPEMYDLFRLHVPSGTLPEKELSYNGPYHG